MSTDSPPSGRDAAPAPLGEADATAAASGRLDLARWTEARVALGRSGAALPTAARLAFAADHARARDAVWARADFDSVDSGLRALGLETVRVCSQAEDRMTYLRRPDLGRRLDDASLALLSDRAAHEGTARVVLVVADGLSAEAVGANAVPLAFVLLPLLEDLGAPVRRAVLASQGRVAIGDAIGRALGADLAVVFIGERPGLSAADSLGCYVTWNPRPGTPDSRRNCVSNIRRGGLDSATAAERIAAIAAAAFAQRCTGVDLRIDNDGGAAWAVLRGE